MITGMLVLLLNIFLSYFDKSLDDIIDFIKKPRYK